MRSHALWHLHSERGCSCFSVQLSILHAHEKNMNILMHAHETTIYTWQLMTSQACLLTLFLRWYLNQFIPEWCYDSVCNNLWVQTWDVPCPLFSTVHAVETRSTVCSCSRLIYTECLWIFSLHLKITWQFIVPRLVDTALRCQAVCAALTVPPVSQESCYLPPSTTPH